MYIVKHWRNICNKVKLGVNPTLFKHLFMIFTFPDKMRQKKKEEKNKHQFLRNEQKSEDSAKTLLWLGWNKTAHSSNSAKNSFLAKLEAYNLPDTEYMCTIQKKQTTLQKYTIKKSFYITLVSCMALFTVMFRMNEWMNLIKIDNEF